jgi:hypothetical protein
MTVSQHTARPGVYVIEIAERWHHLFGRATSRSARHVLYVGYRGADKTAQQRFEEHLRGTWTRDDIGHNSGRPFRRIRDERERLGMPAHLVEGDDATLQTDLIEEFDEPADAKRREGSLARELGKRKGVVVYSDKVRTKKGTAARKAIGQPR